MYLCETILFFFFDFGVSFFFPSLKIELSFPTHFFLNLKYTPKIRDSPDFRRTIPTVMNIACAI